MITGAKMPERISKTEQVRQRIAAAIMEGRYACGEALPSIEQLAKQFSVSKNTVALALADLNQSGALEMAHGKYTRVTAKLAVPHIMIYASRPYNMEDAPFWGTFYSGIRSVLRNAADVSSRLYTEIQVLRDSTKKVNLPERLDGILLLEHPMPEKMNPILRAAKSVPVISIYEGMDGYYRSAPEILVDYSGAMRDLLADFRRKGVRRCAYAGFFGLEGERGNGVNYEKYRLFHTLAEEAGIELPEAFTVRTLPQLRYGTDIVRKLEESGCGMPDAIFLSSDLLAPGVCRALRDRGIRVPEDILIAGCDNMEIGSYFYPSLTTIDVNSFQIGADAARQMLDRIHSGKEPESRTFPAKLIRRESTA